MVHDGPPPTVLDRVTELWSYVPGTKFQSEDPTVAMTAVNEAPRPGGAAWRVSIMPSGQAGRMHKTPTVDFDVVLSGRVTLVVEEGEVELSAGDFVVINGDLHAWRTSADSGCTMAFVNLHTLPARPLS